MEFVDGHAQMSRVGRTRVHVSIVDEQEIDIVHNEAGSGRLQLENLFETAVHHDALVERLIGRLLANVDAIVQLLTLQNRMRVEEEVLQDLPTIAVRHDDREFMASPARGRIRMAAPVHIRMVRRPTG